MPWTTPETFTAGQTLTAASMNAINGNITAVARGVMAYKTFTSQSNLVTTLADFTGYDITWTAEAGRLYRVSLSGSARGFGASTNNTLYITDTSNNVKTGAAETLTGTDPYWVLCMFYVETGLSGSVTRKVRGENTGGTGMRLTTGFTTTVTTLLVEDIGAA